MLDLKKVGYGIVGIIGLALLVMAIATRVCGWVPAGADKGDAIARGDTLFAEGRTFECVTAVGDFPSGVVLVAGLVLLAVAAVMLYRDWKRHTDDDVVKVRTETGMAGLHDTRQSPRGDRP